MTPALTQADRQTALPGTRPRRTRAALGQGHAVALPSLWSTGTQGRGNPAGFGHSRRVIHLSTPRGRTQSTTHTLRAARKGRQLGALGGDDVGAASSVPGSGGGVMMGILCRCGSKGTWEISVPSSQFHWEPEVAPNVFI